MHVGRLSDPGKYNFTPRLFHLSAASGSFRAEELQSPTRLPGLVMAMPFVQESLYSVPQPGESTLIVSFVIYDFSKQNSLLHPLVLAAKTKTFHRNIKVELYLILI